MTATQDYYDWENAGRHWANAKPVADMQATLEGAGYTVYTIGDQSHLTANPPEDHTPFSHTGWPQPATKGVVDAFDVMPKNGDTNDLANLARALIAAKDAGLASAAFIKYINWTDENGNCYHVSWEPNQETRSSTDKGHIHVSIRSDYEQSNCADGWNPLDGSPVVVPISSGPTTPIPSGLSVDGQLGPLTTRKWQQVMGTPVDGIISTPSMLVKAVQRHLNAAIGAGLVVDGVGIRQDGKFYHTVKALQAYLGTPQDGVMSVPVSSVVKAVQTRLNEGRF